MAALNSSTAVTRHITGDLSVRFFTLSGTNGDTLTVPGVSDILFVSARPTTAIAIGATWTGNVITFVTSGAFAATIEVVSRVG